MSKHSTIISKIKSATLAATVSLGALAGMSVLSTSANAMVIHNCTNQGFQLVMQGKGNNRFPGFVGANSRSNVHTPKGYGPYRIILPALGQGGWFSGRSWNGTYSLVRTAGNIGLRNGNFCPPKVVQPERPVIDQDEYHTPPGHYTWCYERYRSYRQSDNTYQPYSGGRRECISPYL